MVSQPFEEIPDIASRFRDDELGWFQILDGLLNVTTSRSKPSERYDTFILSNELLFDTSLNHSDKGF